MAGSAESVESMEALQQRIKTLEAEVTATRAIVLRVAKARMYRDGVTMMESCPHCSLKRGGEYGYGESTIQRASTRRPVRRAFKVSRSTLHHCEYSHERD
jgi:hypothetical protein